MSRGNWEYDSENKTFGFNTRTGPRYLARYAYPIMFTTSESVLDYVVQMSKKPELSDDELGALVRTLDRALNLQQNLCSFCAHGSTSDKRLSEEKVHTLLTEEQHRFERTGERN